MVSSAAKESSAPLARNANPESTVKRAYPVADRLWISILLCILSSIITYVAIEVVVVRFVLTSLPLTKQAILSRPLQLLSQSSKSGTVPHNYLAIFGDSNAQGGGDWLIDQLAETRNVDYASMHVIHNRSGKDVMSFGFSNSGSFRSLVFEAIPTIKLLRNSWFSPVSEDPEQAVVYFYEGNDLNDNVREWNRIAKFNKIKVDLVSANAREAFAAYTSANSPIEGWFRGSGLRLHFERDFPAAQFVRFFVDGTIPDPTALPPTNLQPLAGGRNRIVLGGENANIPESLQGPAMELNPEEQQIAFSMFAESFKMLREFLPHTKFAVVYLPSPLSSYQLADELVSAESYENRRINFPSNRVLLRSDRYCREIQAAANQLGAQMIDIRSTIRASGEKELLHGPKDWKHFNRQGQEILAGAVVEWMEHGIDHPCDTLSPSS